MTKHSRIRAAVFVACLFTLFFVSAAHAQDNGKDKAIGMKAGMHKLGSMTIQAPWARIGQGARAGAAYLKIVNTGERQDRLIHVAAPVAERVELHTHSMQDGVMRMGRIDAVPVPGNAAAELKPGGHHVMLIALRAAPKQGGTFPLTLTFETAGKITVPVVVRPLTARGPGMKHHDHK